MQRANAAAISEKAREWVERYFRDRDPTLAVALVPAMLVALVLFLRSPWTNYIFDEQEALLANPYVNGRQLGFFDVLSRDFWGLPPGRSIGSYRPIPNVFWRVIWSIHPALKHPWWPHFLNVLLHAVNAVLVARIQLSLGCGRIVAWLSGAAFLCAAVLTEAVAGVVGIADVLGALGVLWAVLALRLPLFAMPVGVFLGVAFGFFSKESTLVALPMVAWAALVGAPLWHPKRPLRALRALLALAAAAAAMVVYTEVRRHFFPVSLPAELTAPLAAESPWYRHLFHEFLVWFAQPRLPHDPINNPLIDADTPHRIAGGLRVYARGIGQVVFPWTLSGDYSFASEPIPDELVTPATAAGAAGFVVPPLVGLGLWFAALGSERRERTLAGPFAPSSRIAAWSSLAIASVWIPIAYFPHSNIPMLLPTVRAERFWYLPALGAALVVGLAAAAILRKAAAVGRPAIGVVFVGLFFGFQAGKARQHAFHYTDDLVFWRATVRAVPASAKAHLNYGVMLGARGRLPDRLRENRLALEIAPKWPMAHVYYADTLCRLDRTDDAWPHYAKGFELAPNDRNLIALGLQCLWDKKATEIRRLDLLRMADERPGTWLAYLARGIVRSGKDNGGVEKRYRPRGYDEGPKDP